MMYRLVFLETIFLHINLFKNLNRFSSRVTLHTPARLNCIIYTAKGRVQSKSFSACKLAQRARHLASP